MAAVRLRAFATDALAAVHTELNDVTSQLREG